MFREKMAKILPPGLLKNESRDADVFLHNRLGKLLTNRAFYFGWLAGWLVGWLAGWRRRQEVQQRR
ncbi:hypothetical protein EC836_103395 [Erwinia sp. JUb26]|nr:hypothetical protein EC836_103395 [Erwinia sp. JUb26]